MKREFKKVNFGTAIIVFLVVAAIMAVGLAIVKLNTMVTFLLALIGSYFRDGPRDPAGRGSHGTKKMFTCYHDHDQRRYGGRKLDDVRYRAFDHLLRT